MIYSASLRVFGLFGDLLDIGIQTSLNKCRSDRTDNRSVRNCLNYQSRWSLLVAALLGQGRKQLQRRSHIPSQQLKVPCLAPRCPKIASLDRLVYVFYLQNCVYNSSFRVRFRDSDMNS